MLSTATGSVSLCLAGAASPAGAVRARLPQLQPVGSALLAVELIHKPSPRALVADNLAHCVWSSSSQPPMFWDHPGHWLEIRKFLMM